MKISQDVRDFANTDFGQKVMADAKEQAKAEAGMAEKSREFLEQGGEIYKKVG